jgi:hypothetical protein
MQVKARIVASFEISDIPALDPVRVHLEDLKPDAGRITVDCYGSAWTAYFGSMSGDTIAQFVSRADTDYLVTKLFSEFSKRTKREEAYLTRLVNAVKAVLATEGHAGKTHHGDTEARRNAQ